jgi:hypothetical protein
LVWKAEGKSNLDDLKCRWENNIKMGLQEIEWRLGLI